MKVIIAGGRDFNNYELLKEKCLNILSEATHVEIVSGHARGADELGERFGQEFDCYIHLFIADWDLYGKKAGFIRNKQMVENADALIAFWDGKSKGTKMMIDIAKKKKLKTRVIYYK